MFLLCIGRIFSMPTHTKVKRQNSVKILTTYRTPTDRARRPYWRLLTGGRSSIEGA